MKRLKAFTLVELIVVIAIFGLLMAGIMNMISPIQSAATESKVVNAQKSLEEGITTYLGENLRYATNLLVVEDGAQVGSVVVDSPAKAIEAFYAFAPINSFGQPYSYDTDSKKNTNIIIWESTKGHNSVSNGKNFYGRMLRSINSSDNITGIGDTLIASDGSKPLYTVFGEPYYGTADAFLKVEMIDGGANGYLKITCDSDYYYTSSKLRANNDSGNPTTTTFELRNMGTKSTNQFKFHMAAKTNVGNGISAGRSDTGSSGKIIYFVYTDPSSEDWTIDMSRTDTVGTSYKDGSSVSTGGSNTGNTGNTGSNTGNTGSNTGNTGSNTGNTGGNTGNTGGNTGNTGNTGGNTGNTGNNGNESGNTGNTGNESGNTGNTGNQGGSGNTGNSPVTAGSVTANNGTNGGNGTVGVIGIKENSNGSVTVNVTDSSGYNDGSFTLTKDSSGNYQMTVGQNYWAISGGLNAGWHNEGETFTLTSEQITWLKDTYGLVLN